MPPARDTARRARAVKAQTQRVRGMRLHATHIMFQGYWSSAGSLLSIRRHRRGAGRQCGHRGRGRGGCDFTVFRPLSRAPVTAGACARSDPGASRIFPDAPHWPRHIAPPGGAESGATHQRIESFRANEPNLTGVRRPARSGAYMGRRQCRRGRSTRARTSPPPPRARHPPHFQTKTREARDSDARLPPPGDGGRTPRNARLAAVGALDGPSMARSTQGGPGRLGSRGASSWRGTRTDSDTARAHASPRANTPVITQRGPEPAREAKERREAGSPLRRPQQRRRRSPGGRTGRRGIRDPRQEARAA